MSTFCSTPVCCEVSCREGELVGENPMPPLGNIRLADLWCVLWPVRLACCSSPPHKPAANVHLDNLQLVSFVRRLARIAVLFETGPFIMVMRFQQSIVNISAVPNPGHLRSRQGALPAPHDRETESSHTHCICSFTLYEGVRLREAEIYAEVLRAL